MLHGLAQADAAGVRAHGHSELRGEEQVGDVLVDPGHTGGVDLHDLNAAGLQQLLEDDAARRVLTGRHPHRSYAAGDGSVAQDVVR